MINVRVKLVIVMAMLLLGQQVFSDDQGTGKRPTGKDVLFGNSDMFAAFIVAFKEHQAWWSARGVQLTQRELVARHYAIH